VVHIASVEALLTGFSPQADSANQHKPTHVIDLARMAQCPITNVNALPTRLFHSHHR